MLRLFMLIGVAAALDLSANDSPVRSRRTNLVDTMKQRQFDRHAAKKAEKKAAEKKVHGIAQLLRERAGFVECNIGDKVVYQCYRVQPDCKAVACLDAENGRSRNLDTTHDASTLSKLKFHPVDSARLTTPTPNATLQHVVKKLNKPSVKSRLAQTKNHILHTDDLDAIDEFDELEVPYIRTYISMSNTNLTTEELNDFNQELPMKVSLRGIIDVEDESEVPLVCTELSFPETGSQEHKYYGDVLWCKYRRMTKTNVWRKAPIHWFRFHHNDVMELFNRLQEMKAAKLKAAEQVVAEPKQVATEAVSTTSTQRSSSNPSSRSSSPGSGGQAGRKLREISNVSPDVRGDARRLTMWGRVCSVFDCDTKNRDAWRGKQN